MRQYESQIKTWLLFALTLITIEKAAGGSEANLFVPNQYAPLSSYVAKTSTNSEILVFSVKPALIQYVVSNGLAGWVAFQNVQGAVSLLSPTSYNITDGTVSLQTNLPGKYVIVAETFTNDYPIVTHWRQSLNAGKGGYELGAADPIGTIDFDPSAGAPSLITDIFDSNPLSIYTYNTEKYALFSSDTMAPQARVPGFERYVGENYAVAKISDRMAVYLSLKSIESTGFPLLHRSHPWAFYEQSPAGKKVLTSAPAFQAVHAIPIEAEAGKPSLITYILPPNWNKSGATYPILFNGFYDIHENFALANGSDFINVIGNLINANQGSSIGVLWNGGGAYGSQTINLSSYLNVAFVFYITQSLAHGDPYRVVTAGISRGGSSAFNVAANPIFDNYRVRYALVHSPPVKFGEHVMNWFTTNYPGDYANVAWATGYKYAYQTNFVDPLTGLNGKALTLQNISGSVDPAYADLISPLGDWLIDSLKAKGTSVLLSAGTHDAFIPFHHQMLLHERLKNKGVPVELNIAYRFGHNYFLDKVAAMQEALRRVLTGSTTVYSGTKHFRREGEFGESFSRAVQFTPSQTLSVELPKQVYHGQQLKLSVSGSMGLHYIIAYFKINDSLWNSSRQVTLVGDPQIVAGGVFNVGTEPLQSHAIDFNVPGGLTTGKYLYFIMTSPNGNDWTLMDLAKVPQAVSDRVAVFDVTASEPTLPALEINQLLNIQDRGWGLCSY